MLMTKQTTGTLMENAEINFLYSAEMKGYLYEEKVFVHMDDNNKPLNVYALDEEAEEEVGKVLYMVESVIDSLGLNLKEDTMFSQEAIEEKMKQSFPNLAVIVGYFNIVVDGKEIQVFAPTEEVEEEVLEAPAAVETEVAETTSSLTGFSEALKKMQGEEETTVEEVAVPELSRQEKGAVVKARLMELITEPSVAYTTKSLVPKVRGLTDFEVGSTEVRNYLIDLVNDGKLEYADKTNAYRLVTHVQASLFDDAPEVDAPAPAPVEKAQTPKAKVAEQTAPVAQEVEVEKKAVPVAYVTVNEELKQAETYSSLFFDDAEVAEYLKLIGIPSALADWAIAFRTHNRNRLKTAPQTVVDVIPNDLAYLGNKETLMKSLAAMKSDTPLSLKGPAGTGKTTLVDTIGAILNLPVFSINGSLESNKATLVGEPTIKQQGVISIKDGQMQKAAMYGGLLYIDEINMMRPDILSIANSMLDHRKAFYNDVRSEMTFAIKETRFISAMNEGYAGTKQMNKATGDRKLAIRLDYMNKKELKDVLAKIVEGTEEGALMSMADRDVLIEKVAKFYNILSQKAKQNLVPELAASTRSIIQLVKNVPILGFQLSLEMVFDKFTEEEIAQIKGALTGSGLEEELNVKFTH